jgi:DNA-binding CsgD family transcriptional regulator
MASVYDGFTLLSRKELLVLAGRLRGLGVKQLAEELELSAHTVRHHIESIHIKLNVHSLQQAVCALESIQCRHCQQGGLFALFAAEAAVIQNVKRASFKRRATRARIPCPRA